MKSIVNYLALLAKYPKLHKLLEFASSINPTHEEYFYAFDEALETSSVKYIKFIILTERKRMDLLFGEFIGDRVVDGRYELFWGLVNSLLTAFDLPNPTSLPLFQNCKELTENGYAKLFSCYSKGEERLVQIYRQEEEGLVATKTKNIKIAERTSKKYPPQSEAGLPQDLRNHGM
ncbi:14225_t:CDS:2 [Rhizophagus irregularis]|nr:14225_t:CDS:2 [Rhizophagus irregularis]